MSSILRERLRPFQWVAIALAATGVGYLAIVYGDVPWIAIGLAVTFGTYGLVKKKAPLGSVAGLTLETGLLFVPAVVFLIVVEMRGTGAFLRLDARDDGASSPPRDRSRRCRWSCSLRPFSASRCQRSASCSSSRRRFSSFSALLVYHEPFSHQQLIGFAFVWSAVIVFAAEGILTRAQQRLTPVLDEGEF